MKKRNIQQKKSLLIASSALALAAIAPVIGDPVINNVPFTFNKAHADSVTPAANIDWNNWQKNAQFSLSNNWYSSDSAFTKNSDGTYSVDFKNQPQFSVVSQGDTIGTIGMTRIAVAIIDAADGTSSINNLTSDVTVSDQYGHSYTASGTLVAGQNPYHFKDENGSWHTVTRHIVYIDIPNSELTNFTYSTIGAAQFNISFSANMNSIPNYPTNWIRYGSESDTTPTLNGDGSPATANQTATEISTNTVNNLPQVTKVYYKDAATGNEIASSEILGKGGTTNTPVSAKMKDLTSLSYTFVKGEYLNNTGTDNYFTDNSYDTTLNNTKQAVVFWYSRNQGTADVTYIDDTTGKTLSSKDLSGNTGSVSDYVTSDTISDYENQGYSLVSDNYPSSGVTFTDEHQHYEVHLKHNVTKETESENEWEGPSKFYLRIQYVNHGITIKTDIFPIDEAFLNDKLINDYLNSYLVAVPNYSYKNFDNIYKVNGYNKHQQVYYLKVNMIRSSGFRSNLPIYALTNMVDKVRTIYHDYHFFLPDSNKTNKYNYAKMLRSISLSIGFSTRK